MQLFGLAKKIKAPVVKELLLKIFIFKILLFIGSCRWLF